MAIKCDKCGAIFDGPEELDEVERPSTREREYELVTLKVCPSCDDPSATFSEADPGIGVAKPVILSILSILVGILIILNAGSWLPRSMEAFGLIIGLLLLAIGFLAILTTQ